MKKVISITEVVDSAADWQGAWEVCASAEAGYDETAGVLQVELRCGVRSQGSRAAGEGIAQDWLPKPEVVRERVSLDESIPTAREIFRSWIAKVRRSIPMSVKP